MKEKILDMYKKMVNDFQNAKEKEIRAYNRGQEVSAKVFKLNQDCENMLNEFTALLSDMEGAKGTARKSKPVKKTTVTKEEEE